MEFSWKIIASTKNMVTFSALIKKKKNIKKKEVVVTNIISSLKTDDMIEWLLATNTPLTVSV